MLFKAPIHNLTLSLICHFEVNCLHINPIIGEILLIHINFQPNFPYFSSYGNFYCIEICLPTVYFTSSQCVLKCGFPKFGLFFLKPPAGFHCHKCLFPTFTNIWSHCPWALLSAALVYYTITQQKSKCLAMPQCHKGFLILRNRNIEAQYSFGRKPPGLQKTPKNYSKFLRLVSVMALQLAHVDQHTFRHYFYL